MIHINFQDFVIQNWKTLNFILKFNWYSLTISKAVKQYFDYSKHYPFKVSSLSILDFLFPIPRSDYFSPLWYFSSVVNNCEFFELFLCLRFRSHNLLDIIECRSGTAPSSNDYLALPLKSILKDRTKMGIKCKWQDIFSKCGRWTMNKTFLSQRLVSWIKCTLCIKICINRVYFLSNDGASVFLQNFICSLGMFIHRLASIYWHRLHTSTFSRINTRLDSGQCIYKSIWTDLLHVAPCFLKDLQLKFVWLELVMNPFNKLDI